MSTWWNGNEFQFVLNPQIKFGIIALDEGEDSGEMYLMNSEQWVVVRPINDVNYDI